ncbi:kinase-like domain-containing protein [Microdochium trichocladiopsis]|uniref:Kinase-like domain-containing protein n=1 Tax=Microdochium trichocladiopsis TaxID=1682393 RepID=A0A9P8Y3K2_9PEZI|nr:kinase-like domain-containing protein [Microdochium trichocladiopsis]KAH7028952.1 kinase-like domain-containing protein [Microdochium trichocladiopsis]
MATNGHTSEAVRSPIINLGSEEALPVTVAELTAEWFTKTLGHKVKSAQIVKEIHGTASKILVELQYDGDDAAATPPTKLCVKGGFNPTVMKLYPPLVACFRLEVFFYAHIAPKVPMRLPQVYYTGTDTVNGQGLFIMQDMTAMGATYGSTLEPWRPERVRAGVKQLALLHAHGWGTTDANVASRFPWYEASSFRAVLESMWAPEHWQGRYFSDACPPVHEELKDRARVVAAFHTLWRTSDARLQTMCHGDPHLNNTYMTADGRPGFIDWQGMHPNSALHDVVYFITGAMEVEDRRKHERELLGAYLGDLAEAGGPRFAVDDVWDEFRRQQLHGFVWSLTPPTMQPREVVDTFSARHAAAIKDHGSLELIEAHPDHKPLEE